MKIGTWEKTGFLLLIIFASLYLGIAELEPMANNDELDNINALTDIFSKLNSQMVTLKALNTTYDENVPQMNGNNTILWNLQSIIPIMNYNQRLLQSLSKNGYFPSKTLANLTNTQPDDKGVVNNITTMTDADALSTVAGILAYHQKYINDLLNTNYSSIKSQHMEATERLITV
jgi:hypothetical protein